MKRFIKKNLITVFLSLLSTSLFAFDFTVDGIYYNINSDNITCSVTSGTPKSYAGAVVIPTEVIYNSKRLKVTRIDRSAFSYCDYLLSVVIPESVNEIDNSAFSGCKELTSVKIPNSVTSIGSYTFNQCEKLQEVILPPGLTTISEGLFYFCTNLKSVNIPQNISSIGNEAFRNCSNLTSIDIPSTVSEIGDYAFYGCIKLSDINIESKDYEAGRSCFWYVPVEIYTKTCYINCPIDATNVNIPDGITEICSNAFAGCKQLNMISIPNSVTTIADNAFNGCSSLTSITIPNSVTSIGDYAFQNCSSLTSINIPNSVTNIGRSVFSGCYDLSSINIPNSVTNIGINAFYYCSKLSSVTLGNSIKTIESGAFSGCKSITSLTIPSSVTKIASDAFKNITLEASKFVNNSTLSASSYSYWGATICNVIDNDYLIKGTTLIKYIGNGGDIITPQGITTIGENAFENSDITSLSISEGITDIKSSAFYNCAKLEKISLPSSINSICYDIIDGCTGLSTINISNLSSWCNIIYKTSSGFNYSSGNPFRKQNLLINGNEINELVIPSDVTNIYPYTFVCCKNIKKIIIPSTIESIYSDGLSGITLTTDKFINNSSLKETSYSYWGANVYDEITEDGFCIKNGKLMKYIGNATDITIPANVSSISSYVFSYSKITSVIIPDNVTSMYSAFSDCNTLKEATIYGTPAKNMSNAFQNCNGLTTVTIAEGATILGGKAFWNCKNLTTVNLPNTLTEIKDNAFYGCSKLTEINLPESLTTIGETSGVFDALRKIRIPQNVTTISSGAFNGCYVQKDNFTNNSSLNAEDNGYWAIKLYDRCTDEGLLIADNTVIKYQGEGTDVIIPDGITKIGDYAFKSSNITSVTIPEGVVSIGVMAFYGCSELISANIPYGVTTIEKDAFEDCTKLSSVNIPVTMQKINDGAFCRTALQNIILPNSIKTLYQSVLFGTNIKNCFVPKSISYVYRGTLDNCKDVIFEDNAGSVICQDCNASDGYFPTVLNDAVNLYIGSDVVGSGYSYSGELLTNSVRSITFGQKVSAPFSNYYNMRRAKDIINVTCLAKTPFTCPTFFCQNLTVYVPKGSKSAYSSDASWGIYNIVEVNHICISMDEETSAYTPDFDIDLSNITGIEAFVIDSYSSGVVKLKKIEKIQAGQGVILKGQIGNHVVPCTNIKTTIAESSLIGTISGTFLKGIDDGKKYYYLSLDDGNPIFKAVDAKYGKQLNRNAAYLAMPATCLEEEICIKEVVKNLIDGQSIVNNKNEDLETLTYTRSFSNTYWQALYVPFSMSYDDWKDDFEVAYINDVHQYDDDEDGAIDRTDVEVIKLKEGKSIEPNTPYLIKAKTTGEKTITIEDATLYKTEENTYDVTSWFTRFNFIGTYHTVSDMATKGYYAMAEGTLKQATSNSATLNPFRWYLSVTDRNGNAKPLNSKSINIVFDDGETTGIEQIENEGSENGIIHTLTGIRKSNDMKSLAPGMYIKNGKKFIVK